MVSVSTWKYADKLLESSNACIDTDEFEGIRKSAGHGRAHHSPPWRFSLGEATVGEERPFIHRHGQGIPLESTPEESHSSFVLSPLSLDDWSNTVSASLPSRSLARAAKAASLSAAFLLLPLLAPIPRLDGEPYIRTIRSWSGPVAETTLVLRRFGESACSSSCKLALRIFQDGRAESSQMRPGIDPKMKSARRFETAVQKNSPEQRLESVRQS